MSKLTPAMKRWLAKIERHGDKPYPPKPTNDMAGRLADLGVVEILKERETSKLEWPWGNWTVRITDAGRAALSNQKTGEA